MVRKSSATNKTKNLRGSRKEHQPLTDREWLVLQLIAEGLSNQEIAGRLTLSLTTVKWYVKQIFNKLGANRRTQAIQFARSLNLIANESPAFRPEVNLPMPQTNLIGREHEIAELIGLLNSPATRLVTILGPGGIGKTQLALEIARAKAKQSRLEVYFAALDGVDSVAGVVSAAADAIGFQFHGATKPEKQILVGLQSREILLVLDNFEHVMKARSFITDLLKSVGDIKILVTSRERLNLHAEIVYPLKGLPYPEASDDYHSYAAIQLFLEATQRVHPAFEPSYENLIQIGRICQLVDGMPLAIELATAWLDVLTLEQVVSELSSSAEILKTSMHDLPERHRSMQVVFEYSWQLLSDAERNVLKRLSVFRGGFDRTAADKIADSTLFVLSTLIDKSLVNWVGPDRFKLHEMLRQFAEEKLRMDAGEYADTLLHHSQYYARFAQQCEVKFKTDFASYLGNMMGILKDFDNIMAGWQCALDAALIDEISNYAFTISLTFFFRGLIADGENIFAQAIKIVENRTDLVGILTRMRLMTYHGWHLSDLMQNEKAQQILEDALKLVIEMNSMHTADVGLLLGFLGWVLCLNNQADVGRERLRQALATCEEQDFQLGAWICQAQLGEIEYCEGNYELALQYQYQAMKTAEHHQSLAGIMNALVSLGSIHCALDNISTARDYLHRGLTLNREFLAPFPFFMALLGICAICESRNQPDLAMEFLTIVLFHPQRGAAVDHKAHRLLELFQKRLPMDEIQIRLEKAKQGKLSNQYLNSNFVITVDLVDKFLQLISSLQE